MALLVFLQEDQPTQLMFAFSPFLYSNTGMMLGGKTVVLWLEIISVRLSGGAESAWYLMALWSPSWLFLAIFLWTFYYTEIKDFIHLSHNILLDWLTTFFQTNSYEFDSSNSTPNGSKHALTNHVCIHLILSSFVSS